MGDMGPRGFRGPAALPPARLRSKVINAITGRSIKGVKVQIMQRERAVATFKSKRGGNFKVDVPVGNSQIVATSPGFMTFRRSTMLLPRMVDTERILMVPQLDGGKTTFVLTWNPRLSNVTDMDLHLRTPWGCDVYAGNRVCQSGTDKAHLDSDDAQHGGPEAATIDSAKGGVFRIYAVRVSSGDIEASRAVLWVFKSDGTAKRYSLGRGDGVVRDAAGEPGLPAAPGAKAIWEVCTFDATKGTLIKAGSLGTRRVLQFSPPPASMLAAASSLALVNSQPSPFVQADGLTKFPSEQLTVAMWVKVDSAATGAGADRATIFSYATEGRGGASAFSISNLLAMQVCAAGSCGVFTDVALADPAAYGPNSTGWRHVAVVWKASGSPKGNTKIYVDGVRRWRGVVGPGKTIASNGTLVLGNAQLAPGKVPAGPASAFIGRLADITVWNRALRALEVQRLLASHPSGSESGLVLYYGMLQPEDRLRELVDSSPSKATGRFVLPNLSPPGSQPLDTATAEAAASRLSLVEPVGPDACRGFEFVPVPCAPPNW